MREQSPVSPIRYIFAVMLGISVISFALASKAQNICVEYGPRTYSWSCITEGSANGGALDNPELSVCAGQSILMFPMLDTPPTITHGLVERQKSYDCPVPHSQSEYRTLHYLVGDLTFVPVGGAPSITSTFTVAGTYNYNAYVEVYPSSLLAWWSGDTTTAESVYGNHCALAGGVDFAPAVVGDGFSFDGMSGHASVSDNDYLDVGEADDFSIECWIQAPSTATGVRYIVSKLGSVGGRAQGYLLYLSNGRPYFRMYTSTGLFVAVTSTSLLDGNFHHIAVTVDRDSTTGFRLYVDGISAPATNPSLRYGDLSNSEELFIGKDSGGGSGFFEGVIDELSIYHCALSESDILAIYDKGALEGLGKKWDGQPEDGALIPQGCVCSPVEVDLGQVEVTVLGAPELTLSSSVVGQFTRGAPPAIIDTSVTVGHSSMANFNGGQLNIAFTGAVAGDRLRIRNQGVGTGEIGFDGSDVKYQGTTIGSVVADGVGLNPLTVQLGGSSTLEAVQALVRNVTYQYVSAETISEAPRPLSFSLTDGQAGLSCDAVAVQDVSVVCPPALDVMMVIDTSGSMQNYMEDVQYAATTFVNSLLMPPDQAGLISFSNSAFLNIPLTDVSSAVTDAIGQLTANGSTATGDAVQVATENLLNPDKLRIIVLITDGDPTVGSPTPEDYARSKAAAAKAAGIRLITIGLGSGVVDSLLTDMASENPSQPSGKDYYKAPTSQQLQSIYAGISESVCRDGINLPPVLTTVATLTGAKENKPFQITYETLLAASNASDPDGDEVWFRVNSLENGQSIRIAGVKITDPGAVLVLEPGQHLTWVPPVTVAASGPIDAFTVVAKDEHGAESAPPVTVRVDVSHLNAPPTVIAGNNWTLPLPMQITLEGSVTDDERILQAPVINWQKVVGPADVDFADRTQPNTTATFTHPGHYVLRLTASDGEHAVSDEIVVDICAERDLPLDVIFLLDCSGSMDGVPLETAELSIQSMLQKLRLDGSADTDTYGLGVLEYSTTHPEKEYCEYCDGPDYRYGDSMAPALELNPPGRMALDSSSDALLMRFYSNLLNARALDEDFEPAFHWAISTLANNLRTRDARPLIVIVSDFQIGRHLDPLILDDPHTGGIEPLSDETQLINLANRAREAGIRVVTLGVGDYSESRMADIASTATDNDLIKVDDIAELAAVFDSLRKNCEQGNPEVVTFAYEDRLVQNSDVSISPFVLDGTIVDLRPDLPGNNELEAQWLQTGGPTIPNPFSNPQPSLEDLSTSVTIPPLALGSPDRVFEFTLETKLVGGLTPVSRSTVTVTVQDTLQNRKPLCNWENYEVTEDSVNVRLEVLANDLDPENDELFISAVKSHLELLGLYHMLRGSVTISSDKKALIFTPDPDYNHYTPLPDNSNLDPVGWPQTLQYTVVDRDYILDPGGIPDLPPDHQASESLAAVYVTPVNDPPSAKDDTIAVDKNQSFVDLDVLANDPNVDYDEYSSNGDKLYSIVDVSVLTPDVGTLEISADKRLLRYYPDAGQPDYQVDFDYTLRDVNGQSATAHVTLHVGPAPNFPPEAEDDVVTIWLGSAPVIDILANDRDPNLYNDPYEYLTISYVSDWAHFTLSYFPDGGQALRFNPGALTEGPYQFTYTVSDRLGASDTATLTIHLASPGDPPIAVDDNRFSDNGGTIDIFVDEDEIDANISVIDNDDGTGIKVISVTTPNNGQASVAVGGESVLYTPQTGYSGSDTFAYTVADVSGRTASATVEVVVVKSGEDTDPVAALANVSADPVLFGGVPDDIPTVSDGVFGLLGTANDDDEADALYYRVEVHALDEQFFPVGTVAVVDDSKRVTGIPGDDLLAQLDLRGVANGVYLVVLSVYSADHPGVFAQGYINLQSQYKIGNLRFSETDMTVQVAGLPISVVRTYDSLNAAAARGGQFGAGWTLDMNDIDVQFNEVRQTISDAGESQFSLRVGGGRDVSLTLPDGRRATFAFDLRVGGLKPYADWTSITPGVVATLQENPLDWSYINQFYGVWQRNGNTGLENYEFQGYTLTLDDGTTLEIERESLGEYEYGLEGESYIETYGKARVSKIRLPSGARYSFGDNGLEYFLPSASSPELVLKYEVDVASGLITAIHDRHTIDANGAIDPAGAPAVKYDYEDGRLVRVHQLRDRSGSDPIYDTTQYLYKEPSRPDLITAVIDPRGVRLAQTYYDDAGRLSKVETPDGRWSEYHHDDTPEAPGAVVRERIVDSEGQTAIADTDARGNVLLSIDPLGTRTERAFDHYDNTTSQRVLDPSDNVLLESSRSMDYHGSSAQIQHLLTVQSPNGAQPEYSFQEFDGYGRLLRSVDAANTDITTLANVGNLDPEFWMEYKYDDDDYNDGSTTLNLTKTIAAWKNAPPGQAGTTLILSETSYYPDGHSFKGLTKEIRNAEGSATQFDYYLAGEAGGRFGDLKTLTVLDSASVERKQTAYQYDEVGNRTHEIRRTKNGGGLWEDYAVAENVFDPQSRLVETIDAGGGHSFTAYGAAGRVKSTTDRYGATTRYKHDAMGDLVETEFPELNGSNEHPLSRTVTFYEEFDDGVGNPRLLKHVLREDRHWPITEVLEGTGAGGTLTVYDELDRPIRSIRLTDVFTTSVAVDGAAKTGLLIDFDVDDLPPYVEVAVISESRYDAAGRAYMTADALGKWTLQEYDSEGRVWRTKQFVDADGHEVAGVTITMLRGYDEAGRQLWSLDPNQYAYLAANHPSDLTGTPEEVHSKLYGDTTKRKRLTHHEFDDFGRITRTYSPLDGNDFTETETLYNSAGQAWLMIDADDIGTAFFHDNLGRLTWVVTDVDVDPVPAFPTTMQETHEEWVDWATGGRTASDSTATQFKYDELDRLVEQIDAQGRPTTFAYDGLGRRTARTLPDSSYETWDYDVGSVAHQPQINEVRYRDFAGVYTRSVYDEAGRLKRRFPEDVVSPPVEATRGVAFTYTASGNRATMTDGDPSVVGQLVRTTYYQYDLFDRPTGKDVTSFDGLEYSTISYHYDDGGNLKEVSGPTSQTTYYHYDQRNRLWKVNPDSDPESDPSVLADATYSYDESGNLTSVEYRNGVESTYEYNYLNQLRYLKAEKGSATLATFDYDSAHYTGPAWPDEFSLRPSGQRQGVAEMIAFNGTAYHRLVAYNNDNLGRIQAERIRSNGDSWPAAWAPVALPTLGSGASGDLLYDVSLGYDDPAGNGYDRVGNRQSREVDGVTIVAAGPSSDMADQIGFAYDDNDRLHNNAGSYDANGNANYQATYISEQTPGQVVPTDTYQDEYDFENRLIKRSDDTTTIKFVYDGDGNRVRKIVEVGGNTYLTIYAVDDRNLTGYPQVLGEWDYFYGWVASYTYGADLISQTRSLDTHYYGYDGQGTVRYLTDSEGVMTDAYTYDAFGILLEERNSSTPTVNHYRYAGEQWDAHLGMYYLRARYYQPDIGRFWSMDTFEGTQSDPLTLHKYLYAHANPVNGIDPSGHQFSLSSTLVTMKGGFLITTRASIAAYGVYDRTVWLRDGFLLARSVARGSLDPMAAAFWASEFIPYSRLFNKAKTLVARSGVVEGLGKHLTDVWTQLRRTGNSTGEAFGELGLASVARLKRMEPVSYTPRGNGGFDGVFKDRDGFYVVCEAKGGVRPRLNAADPNTGNPAQMSKDWIRKNIDDLQGYDPALARKLDEAYRQGRIRGMVVKTKIDGDLVSDPEFDLRDLHEIGKSNWNP